MKKKRQCGFLTYSPHLDDSVNHRIWPDGKLNPLPLNTFANYGSVSRSITNKQTPKIGGNVKNTCFKLQWLGAQTS